MRSVVIESIVRSPSTLKPLVWVRACTVTVEPSVSVVAVAVDGAERGHGGGVDRRHAWRGPASRCRWRRPARRGPGPGLDLRGRAAGARRRPRSGTGRAGRCRPGRRRRRERQHDVGVGEQVAGVGHRGPGEGRRAAGDRGERVGDAEVDGRRRREDVAEVVEGVDAGRGGRCPGSRRGVPARPAPALGAPLEERGRHDEPERHPQRAQRRVPAPARALTAGSARARRPAARPADGGAVDERLPASGRPARTRT